MAISKIVYKESANATPVTWQDVTDTTAVASDVAAGKYFYTAAGVKTLGTGSGGGGGGATPVDAGVHFIDYDGTLVESWETSAVAGKTALPSNPSHTGLTAQGWNWTLAQIQAQYAANPSVPLYVGQHYVTASGATEIDILLNEGRLNPYLALAINGSVDIDWGDGSAHDTVTGTSLTTQKRTAHAYTSPGAYTIAISVNSGSYSLYAGSSNLILNADNTANRNRVYTNSIQAVRLGASAVLGYYSFIYAQNMQYITMPSSVTAASTVRDVFNFCSSLKWVSMPASLWASSSRLFYNCYGKNISAAPGGATVIPSNAYYQNYALRKYNIPDTVTSIADYAFYNCLSLSSITIPSSVTSIATNGFGNCYGLGEIHFKATSPPTVENSNAFINLPTDCKIYVPSGKLAAYTSESNYPSSGTYTYIEE